MSDDTTICALSDKPGEGCQKIFPNKKSIGLCGQCTVLSNAKPGSGDYEEKLKWKQCTDCGVCGRRMDSSRCGRCEKEVDKLQGCVNEVVITAQQQRSEALSHRMKRDSNGALRSNAIPMQLNPLASIAAQPQLPLTTQALNQARHIVNGTSVHGNSTHARQINVHMEVRIDGKISSWLGPRTAQFDEGITMDELIVANLCGWNAKWTKKYSRSLTIEDTDLRFHSNRNVILGTEHLTLGDFYDTHAKSKLHEVYFTRLPKSVPVLKGSKIPLLALEVWIDTSSYHDRGLDMDTTISAMVPKRVGIDTRLQGKRRNVGDLASSANVPDPKRIRLGSHVLQSAYQHRSSFNAPIENTSAIKLLGALRKASQTEVVAAQLGDESYHQGKTKLVYKLTVDGQDKPYIAKRFFDIGAGSKEQVNPNENRNNLHAELRCLKLGQWFLSKFYDHARELGAEVFEGEIRICQCIIAREVIEGSEKPSQASGYHVDKINTIDIDDPEDGVYWLIEERRSPIVTRFTGTMVHPWAQGKQAITISAFAHFVYVYSGEMWSLRYSSISALSHDPRRPNVQVLFDIMTHTPEGGVSFVGDIASHGQEGDDDEGSQGENEKGDEEE
ncbi:hypothetical protein A0H81_11427 [Grifola frondosa]|uniref:Alpha-type protein kinase domain-containing protein n=1 Tax=Grifola frondosa TaxID=5627 RepID=A0A1C7LVI6_GRIFR|nr:hypothetical protein A0H81_11427 [Grifola frondosa]